MLVQEWMTKNVTTVTPETSIMKASRLMKDGNFRRVPVVDENGCLVGIVSDRDIKDASPSKATTLDMHELYYLLSEMKIKEIMTKNPVSAKLTDSVELIAHTMITNRFGGVPVVDETQKVLGIITNSDIFKLLLSITGMQSGGIQLAFELENKPGELRPILDTLREAHVSVVTVLTAQGASAQNKRRVYIRIRPLPKEQEQEVVRLVSEKFILLYWEPGLIIEKDIAHS